MADDLLARLDSAVTADRPLRQPLPQTVPAGSARPATAPDAPSLRERWPWLTIFLGIQFLWGALLFVPGSQDYRPIVRALPYASALALLAVYGTRTVRARAPGGTLLLVFAIGLLGINLLHPTSQLQAGLAQLAFQMTIAAPMFWAWKGVSGPSQLRRLLWLCLIFNAAGALLGVLQVYDPERFMPPQFSTLGLRLNELYVESLTYVGRDGTRIVRPPGLSDQPGGAAASGALAVVLGGGLSLGAANPRALVVTVAAMGVGLAAIYLTQVRSLLLMALAALAVIALVLFRRGQLKTAAGIAVTATLLAAGAFFWARALVGEAVEERFATITEEGALQAYRENRGAFVAHTFGELLDRYPFGAGVGRWGMMQVYFGDPTNLEAQPIYVEIQITGWLLDGGVPMWVLYGGAILFAMIGAYRHARQRRSQELAGVALIVLAAQVLIVGFSWAGPAFNTQLGLFFWFLTSALHGAASGRETNPRVASRASP